MGSLGHYASVALKLNPSELARLVVRRANRAVRKAIHPFLPVWTGPRLSEALGGVSTDVAVKRLLGGAPAWCDVERRQEVLTVLERLPGSRARALRRSEAAAQRHFHFFGTTVTKLDWHLDPVSQVRFPVERADAISLHQPGRDPKYPWALGRLDQLIALGQGAWVAREEADRQRYARVLVAQLQHFLEHNPVGVGVQWTCAMEVALRAANIAQALRMVRDQLPYPSVALELLASLENHCDFVEAHLEDHTSVSNNHLVSNHVGLFVVSVLFPELPRSSMRIAHSSAALRELILEQVHDDGYSFEGSVPYHRLSTELFTLAYVTARAHGVDLGARYEERLRRMFEVARDYCSERGLAPQVGDNDSGRVLPLADRASLDHGYLAPLGAALLGEASLKAPRGRYPDEAAWLLGERGWRRFARLASNGRARGFSSPAGGLHVLRGAGATLTVSAGPQGQRGVGGHSHNDKLSFELHLNGRVAIADPGTGIYSRDPSLRNELRSTRAHNTPEVNGLEQAPFDPERLFGLPDRAHARLLSRRSEGGAEILVAAHSGYAPIELERSWTLDPARRCLLIVDSVRGEGRHLVRIPMHLPDERARLRPATNGELARARALHPAELSKTVAELGSGALVFFGAGASVELESCRYSPGYGEVVPARRLVMHATAVLPATFESLVVWEGRQ
jgi:hypothetical protein